ncbi:MAG: helix-turn-helix transcriptional regulator [Nocardia sp.]|nr:helix-turn-helix transcriptional regulator [Nocardia sp.]
MSKSYGQYCGLARALEIVGDRWNLLIVRELLMGPARYRELRDGLPGVATNLLAGRLRDLEAAGVVERRPALDGNAIAYALTAWGAELKDPIESLVRWSTPLMVPGPGGDVFRPEWLGVALPALLSGRAPGDTSTTVGVTVDGRTMQLRATPDGVEVLPHDGGELDGTIGAEAMVLFGLAAGMLDLDDVRSAIELDGDEEAVRAAFRLPARPQ